MNFKHERGLESLSIGSSRVTTIHSNGYGGIRIELSEEDVMDEFDNKKLIKYMSTVLSQEDAIRLRDNLLNHYPLEK